MVVTPARAALLIAAGFLVYLATDVAGYYSTAPIFILSIAGTVLIYMGGNRILKGQPGAARLGRAIVIAALIGAMVLGRMLLRMDITADNVQLYSLLSSIQFVLFAIAGAVPLFFLPAPAARGLAVGALLLAGVAAVVFTQAVSALVDGTISVASFDARVLLSLVLSDLMFVPAAVAWMALRNDDEAVAAVAAVNPLDHEAHVGVRVLSCPKCKARVQVPQGTRPSCGQCGYGA